MVGMWKAAHENDLGTLARLHTVTYPVNTELFCAPNPCALKWALAKLGLCENVLRLPLAPIEEKEQGLVGAALESVSAAGVELIA